MQRPGASMELGPNAGEDRPDATVTQRRVLWGNIWLPVVAALWIGTVAFGLAHLPWNNLWNGSLDEVEAQQFAGRMASVMWVSFFFAFVLLINRHWFSRRACRCRVVFGSKRRVHCSSSEMLNAFSAPEFFRARVLPYTETALYTIDTASGPLTVSGTFASVAALADWRFGADAIREALDQMDFPRWLEATRETLSAAWFRRFATAYILLDLFVPLAIAAVMGDSGPFPMLDAVSALAAAVLACVYPFFVLCSGLALTPENLELRTLFRSKVIPLESIRQVLPGPGEFTLVHTRGGEDHREHIAQCMFTDSILPLYFSLRDRVSGECADSDDAVPAEVAGAPRGR